MSENVFALQPEASTPPADTKIAEKQPAPRKERDIAGELSARHNAFIAKQPATHAEVTPAQPNWNPAELAFPIHLKLSGPLAEEEVAELGGVTFVKGVSVKPLSYRRVKSITGGFGAMTELKTGVRVCPVSEDRTWRAKPGTMFWNDHQPLPSWYEPVEIKIPERKNVAVNEPQKPSGAPENTLPSVETELRTLLKVAGARFIRQVCEQRSVQAARDGETMVKNLVASGITAEEVAALKKSIEVRKEP